MVFIKSYRKKFIIFLAVCFTVMALTYIRTISLLPGQITLIEGQEHVYNFGSLIPVEVKADKDGIIELNNGQIKSTGGYMQLSNPISIKSNKKGSVMLTLKAFGLIPLRTMKVDIVPNKKIVACGNTVGVKLDLNGILVIGISDVRDMEGKSVMPTKESGIKTGDLLVEINGKKPGGIDDLIKEVEKSAGESIKLKYKRGSSYSTAELNPILSSEDKKYHLGLWVRDSTAGIGTLTFYDPDSRYFGALGHGITDIDTGTLMPIADGEILESNILGIKKGKAGIPGELKGVFLEDRNMLGQIKANSEGGIYGILNEDAAERISNKLYPIALRTQIKEGPAVILANIDGRKVEEYEIEIQKVSKQSLSGTKGMIIKITDKRLLDATGGIVQGMSGSPIIQDNKIVGAVTHVLVNDPSRGYGIFIEGMIKNMNLISSETLESVG